MPNNNSAYQANLFSESVSAVTATPSVTIGQRRHEAGRDYMYFYNGTATAEMWPGRCFKLASGSTGYTIDMHTVANGANTADAAMGFVVHATVPTANYFWGCTRGFVQVMTKASAPVTGDQLVVAVSGLVEMWNTAVTGECYAIQACGKAAEDCGATTATASFTAYINCTTAR